MTKRQQLARQQLIIAIATIVLPPSPRLYLEFQYSQHALHTGLLAGRKLLVCLQVVELHSFCPTALKHDPWLPTA